MLYEFTITLKPALYRLSAVEQYRLTGQLIRDCFRGFKVSCVAELTTTHNVHYHCMVELESHRIKDGFLNRFRKHHKYLGRSTCTQLQYYFSYVDYINKSIIDTRGLIGDPIVVDDFSILCDPEFRRFHGQPGGLVQDDHH